MLRVINYLLACLSAARARDVGRALRTMPIVTNSLVNLGKMDIAFYFNARPQDLAMQSVLAGHGPNAFFTPKTESLIMEPCPCSSLKYIRDSTQNHPTDILNKILSSGNDLFSFKEPTSSTLCCDSHENVQEDILLEFGPKKSQILANQQNAFSFLPYLLDSMQTKTSSFMAPAKTKFVDILIYPKKQGSPVETDNFASKKRDIVKKDNIQIVGDKEIRNDFKIYQYNAPSGFSVKKDIGTQEKLKQVTKETTSTIDNKSNTV